MSVTVIKLGGSLIGSEELPLWLESISKLSHRQTVIVVPGGGVFADKVRDMQQLHHLDDIAAHRMALLAMCQYAYYLKGLNPGFEILESVQKDILESGKTCPLIWMPYQLLDNFNEIKPTWDYTSDSIALWLANHLSAESLVLVKPHKLNQIEANYEEMEKIGYIDKGFQSLMNGFTGSIEFLSKQEYQVLR